MEWEWGEYRVGGTEWVVQSGSGRRKRQYTVGGRVVGGKMGIA